MATQMTSKLKYTMNKWIDVLKRRSADCPTTVPSGIVVEFIQARGMMGGWVPKVPTFSRGNLR